MDIQHHSILTTAGAEYFALAIATGTPVIGAEFSLAVGDGGGQQYEPFADQTSLVGEKWRGKINDIFSNENNASQVVIEGIVPTNVGGWFIREWGIYNKDGVLIAVGSMDDTYKSLLASGVGKQIIIQAILDIENAAILELVVDDTVVIASKKYVDDKVFETKEYVDTQINNFSLLLQSEEGSKSIGFLPHVGELTTVESYLKEGYILVKSRDELIAAQLFIKTTLKKRTEVRLARDFAPWTATQTDIDLACVTITGHADGTFIDATGIPNAEGNYFIRFYNSGDQDIGDLPFLDGLRFSGVNVKGPGRNSLVDGILFHSPDHQLGNLTVGYFNLQEFKRGIVFQSNAYIIKVENAYIARCNKAGVDQPYGFSNYGENIALYGCTIAVSGGPAVHINNGNGGFHLHNCSLDYTGQIIVAEAGYVEVHGGHHEFDNGTNPLTDTPYVVTNAQTARITLIGTKMVCIRSAGMTQPYLVKADTGADGVYMFGTQWQNILTASGDVKTGDGRFVARDTQVQNGAGNHRLTIPQSTYENLMVDGGNEKDTPVDWYVRRVNNNVTSRIQGDNITLSTTAEMRRTGTQSLKVTKATAGTNHGIGFIAPVTIANQPAFRFYVYPVSGTNGAIFTESFFVAVQGFDQFGRPNIVKSSDSMGIRTTLLTGANTWQKVLPYPSKTPVPSWATHISIDVNSSGLSVGGYYIDDAGVWQI
ncbi:phage tail protein [Serratia liquefaciens]|uniref:phage tail protein n=1 Tax=Serratia liquefaciens TaxID=614 RepID=UPI0021833A5A|nr:phage tail protein [Serratia liquefaciens]CAI2420789.1 Uncharacterised protein [Serratia liquefaciens]